MCSLVKLLYSGLGDSWRTLVFSQSSVDSGRERSASRCGKCLSRAYGILLFVWRAVPQCYPDFSSLASPSPTDPFSNWATSKNKTDPLATDTNSRADRELTGTDRSRRDDRVPCHRHSHPPPPRGRPVAQAQSTATCCVRFHGASESVHYRETKSKPQARE